MASCPGNKPLSWRTGANNDPDAARRVLDDISDLRKQRGTFYLRRSPLSQQWVAFEDAEITRTAGAAQARAQYERLATSTYPVMASLGYLGIAYCDLDRGDPAPAALNARRIATDIAAGYRVAVATKIIDTRPRTGQPLLFA